jgi:hypothetical protein
MSTRCSDGPLRAHDLEHVGRRDVAEQALEVRVVAQIAVAPQPPVERHDERTLRPHRAVEPLRHQVVDEGRAAPRRTEDEDDRLGNHLGTALPGGSGRAVPRANTLRPASAASVSVVPAREKRMTSARAGTKVEFSVLAAPNGFRMRDFISSVSSSGATVWMPRSASSRPVSPAGSVKPTMGRKRRGTRRASLESGDCSWQPGTASGNRTRASR